MKIRQMPRLRRATAPLILATALLVFGCRAPLRSDIMANKPSKTQITLHDAEEETGQPKRTLDVVPAKKDALEGTIITTDKGAKVLKKKDGTLELLELPERKPVKSVHIH